MKKPYKPFIQKVGGYFKMEVYIAFLFYQIAEYFPGEAAFAVEGPVHKLDLFYSPPDKTIQVPFNPVNRKKPNTPDGGRQAVLAPEGTAPGGFVVYYSVF